MSNEILNNEITETVDTVETAQSQVVEPEKEVIKENAEPLADNGTMGIKFFKSCSTSLKRFSILIFIVNVFLSVAITGVVAVLLVVSVGADMLSLLALPLVTLFVILVVLARCVSAFVYGFAIIVEKAEKK